MSYCGFARYNHMRKHEREGTVKIDLYRIDGQAITRMPYVYINTETGKEID